MSPDLSQIEQLVMNLTSQDQLLLIERIAKLLRRNDIDESWEAGLDAMANDADLQRELRTIDEEFAQTELDGLGE